MHLRIEHRLVDIFLSSAIFISLVACSGAKPLPTLDASQISAVSRRCQDLADATIKAWGGHQADALRQFYTDDIVHYDGSPLYKGINAVVEMAKGLMGQMPESGHNESGQVYVSAEECVDTWRFRGLFGFSQDNPGTEYDLLQFRDGKISFWRLFYDQTFYQDFFGRSTYIKQDLLSQFAAAWSSGSLAEVRHLYSPEIQVDDTLFGYSVTGKEALMGYVNSFLARSPGAKWELIKPFAEQQSGIEPLASHGGIFGITVKDAAGNPCTIETAVILTPDTDGKIIAQKIFYNAHTLIDCSWAK